MTLQQQYACLAHRSQFLKTIIHRKELGLLEEAANLSTGGQDEPEHPAVPGSKEGLKHQWGYISKNTGATLKELT